MASENIIIGVDIGTTGVRAVAYKAKQPIAYAMATTEYPLLTDLTGKAEQNANTILASTMEMIKKVIEQVGDEKSYIKAISLSTVLHSFLAIGEDNTPLSNLMTWGDTQSQIYYEEFNDQLDTEKLYHRTGCPLHPMYFPLKMYWFKKQKADVFNKTKWFGSIKDFVFHHLTNIRIVDRSIASGSGFYNFKTLDWDAELLNFIGINKNQLVDVVPTTHHEMLTDTIREYLDLPHCIPVIIGAGDGMLANIGVGTVKPGQINITIGTSGAIRMIANEPKTDIKRRTWSYNVTDERWMLGGAINNGGISFRWARDKFAESEQRVAQKLGLDPYTLLSHYANKVPAGSDGLIILPFFTGERAPYWNADARGTIFGLTLNHDKRHIIRATLEGVCYRMKSVLDSLEEVTGKANEIRVSGSFTHSPVWLQILSDVLGRNIHVPDVDEGAAYGAAILGFYVIGDLNSLDEVSDLINIKQIYKPDIANTETYTQLYEIYMQIYWNLQKSFTDISNFQRKINKD